MSVFKISNKELSVSIDSLGAEVFSIVRNIDGREYLHTKDDVYWNRVSPVLFPFVGSNMNDEYTYNGKKYRMCIHGFARDCEFTPVGIEEDSISFSLESDEKSLEIYPFEFRLTISYKLVGNTLDVNWNVENLTDGEMYYSIGGHPAFLVPQENFYIRLNKKPEKITGIVGRYADDSLNVVGNVSFDENYIRVEDGLFRNDALVFENYEISEIAFCENKDPYVTVNFTSPAAGIWAPDKKGCPFVCIEPWYGRCDSVDFAGHLEDKKWIRHLSRNEKENLSYTITLN